MLDAIEQAVNLHDKYQVEIKLDYELLPSKKNTLPDFNLHLYSPKSGRDRSDLSQNRFL